MGKVKDVDILCGEVRYYLPCSHCGNSSYVYGDWFNLICQSCGLTRVDEEAELEYQNYLDEVSDEYEV